MRKVLAVLLFAGMAVAAPHDKQDQHPSDGNPSVKAPGAVPPAPSGSPTVRGTVGGGQFVGVRGGRPGPGSKDGSERKDRRDKHHRGGVFYPYPPMPMTWPYPAYPYSQYYYPYPPQYYPGPYDDEDERQMPSTRGLVVPGDLPMGITAFWYYCDAPDGFYPYVKSCSHDWTRIPISPPPPGTAPPLSYSDWQWCAEKNAFFPYVTSCPTGFEPVPVTAPGKDQVGPPQVANWYFCEDPKGYSPYVVQCGRDWRAVPAVPPPSPKITIKDAPEK